MLSGLIFLKRPGTFQLDPGLELIHRNGRLMFEYLYRAPKTQFSLDEEKESAVLEGLGKAICLGGNFAVDIDESLVD